MASSNLEFETHGLLRPELFVGVLSNITAQSVRFNVNSAGSPSATHFKGGRYGRGEVGEFVLIEGQVMHLLGRIVDLRLPDHDRRSVNPGVLHRNDLDAIGTIQLLGSVVMDSLCVTAGVQAYPRLGDRVYSAPHQLLSQLPLLMEVSGAKIPNVLLKLGTIDVAEDSAVAIKPEKLFGRHCAILGATGGGKSWTTARVIEECIKHKAKIILLDATGEYRGFGGSYVEHYHLGNPPEKHPASKQSSLPPASFIESDFIAMFEPAGKVQGPRLQAAIRSLRLVTLEPSLATAGVISKAGKTKKPIEDAERKHSAVITDPSAFFDVLNLVKQIEEECVFPSANFGRDPSKWGDRSESDISYCLSLLTRIAGVMASPSFGCVFKEKSNPLSKNLEDFVINDKRLLRLCLCGVAHEFNAREIVANVIGRKLLAMARLGKFNKVPLVVFLDEAHSFLGRQVGSEDTAAKLDAFELIAKEGRKYGLNICLATQRPRDITEGVLSQMGTLIVHRLTNDRDREVVERACGDIDRAAASFLPTLRPGEAAIIGADFPIPLTIQMYPPDSKPISDGPDYQTEWGS
jgi:Helicase HerA, central domain/Helicase HerA-like C-terminal